MSEARGASQGSSSGPQNSLSLPDGIFIKGAKEHNLKNLDIFIPRNQITVITGVSGSGKSSLAFDTLFAEGQRRYLECLSSYARQFVEQLKKPAVDYILGISPAIAIDQRSVSKSPRSTVGTVSEAYDLLRLLYSKVSTPYCPIHEEELTSRSQEEIIDMLFTQYQSKALYVLAPMVESRKGQFQAELQKWAKSGFVKAKIDGQFVELTQRPQLKKNQLHDIDLVVDQLVVRENLKARFEKAIALAFKTGGGRLIFELKGGERLIFSTKASCAKCGYAAPTPDPRIFSFNTARGACITCRGLGTLDIQEVFEENSRGERVGVLYRNLKALQKKHSEDEESEGYDELSACSSCHGTRLKPDSLAFKILGRNIAELSKLTISELYAFLEQLKLNSRKSNAVIEKIRSELCAKLKYIIQVGCGYLSLDRPSYTLSGGESQRIRLASQVGSSLIGVLYVMDEPSIGLHPHDHEQMLKVIEELKARGNTVVLVEHDDETIRRADHIIDLGPRAGKLGGKLMAQGDLEDILRDPSSLTGQYLSGEKKVWNALTAKSHRSLERSGPATQWIEIREASGNNLKNVSVKFPLQRFIAITGVSGSGKSTLVMDTLFKEACRRLRKTEANVAPVKEILGLEALDKVVQVDQKPIGRSPRSTPATYIGVLPLIRDLFAELPESKIRGYSPGWFSFNIPGGRCENCQGQGQICLSMHFMPDVFIPCEGCGGNRFSKEAQKVRYKGKSISEVLEMSAGEALDFFQNHRLIRQKLELLGRVGLDYIALGQSSTTLSGGEAQRIKLAYELGKRSTGKTLYILDEPTTGLHFEDIRKLLELLHELVDQGNTVVVIEHQLDVIASADFVIDLGPGAGPRGGEVVGMGSPQDLATVPRSHTGFYLKKYFEQQNQRDAASTISTTFVARSL